MKNNLEIFKGNPWDVDLKTSLEPLCPPPPGPTPKVPTYPAPIPPYPVIPPEPSQYVNITKEEKERYDRAFITVDTLADLKALEDRDLRDGKMVRVNDVEGEPSYFVWSEAVKNWVDLGDINSGIPEIVGEDPENPVILSNVDEGLYRVSGYYKISPTDEETSYTDSAYLVFVATDDEKTQVEVITDHSITNYTVEDGEITGTHEFATQDYVEGYVAESILSLLEMLPDIIDERIELAADPISDDFIRSLFVTE